MSKIRITILDIARDLEVLDTVYSEALSSSLMKLKYLTESTLSLFLKSEVLQEEMRNVYKKTLKASEVKKIINCLSDEMKGDFQYNEYLKIASKYINIANRMEKGNKTRGRE